MHAAGKRPRIGSAVGISAALNEFGRFPVDVRVHDEPRQQLAELFAALDRDGDGLLRPGDLPGCWEQVSRELDTTGTGEVSPRSFVANLQRLALTRPCAAHAGPEGDEAATNSHMVARLTESLNAALLELCAELRALAMNSRYQQGPVIGEGSFAVVRRATDCTNGATFALKLVLKSSSTEDEFLSELGVLRKIGRHRRVAGLVDSWANRDSWALLLDLTSGCEVFEAIARKGSFSEADASTLIRQLCDALSYIHGLGVVHRDVKPENLLLRECHPSSDAGANQLDCVLCDFGLAAPIPAQGGQSRVQCTVSICESQSVRTGVCESLSLWPCACRLRWHDPLHVPRALSRRPVLNSR